MLSTLSYTKYINLLPKSINFEEKEELVVIDGYFSLTAVVIKQAPGLHSENWEYYIAL